jgi:hypothetical protein
MEKRTWVTFEKPASSRGLPRGPVSGYKPLKILPAREA